jgi:hypothetical protein
MAEESYYNIAQPGSQVAGQFGKVSGNVHQGNGPAASDAEDLIGRVAELRVALLAARQRNQLDADTWAAAEREVTKVSALLAGSPDDRHKSIALLERLKCLLGKAADLSSKVAAIITAVQSLR